MSKSEKQKYFLLAQFLIALTSMFGSLFFSEVMKLPPCNLCWYQRIFIYPVVLIILSGFYINSQDTNKFITPFVVVGLVFSVYHNLIYYKFIQVIIPCSETAPCTAQQLNYWGFITIPLLSLSAFISLFILNSLCTFSESKQKGKYEK